MPNATHDFAATHCGSWQSEHDLAEAVAEGTFRELGDEFITFEKFSQVRPAQQLRSALWQA